MKLSGLDHVALPVADVGRSADWYIEVLGLERLHAGMWNGVPTFVGTGETGLALFPRKRAEVAAQDGGILHIAFRTDRSNFLAAQEELRKRGIKFSFEDHGIAHSIYFCDPDGHALEITTYQLE